MCPITGPPLRVGGILRTGGRRAMRPACHSESLPMNQKMRSWLFAPGDSARKMEKAIASEADRVILDLEDAVAESAKDDARKLIRETLETQDEDARMRIFVRINPLDGPHALTDLAAVMPGRPGGIILPKVYGRQDAETVHLYLEALEAANGIEIGTTRMLVLITETAESMFHCGDFKGVPRLIGLTWGSEDLADALGASGNREADGRYTFTYEMARSFCLLGASTAGVAGIETIDAEFRDLDVVRRRAERVRRDGFRGMLAIHPAQVPVINEAFTPSAEDIAEAREIVALFAANPQAGTIGHKGKMLDRPHLSRAQYLIGQIDE